MLKNNKTPLIVSSFLIMLPILVHLFVENFLSGMLFMPTLLLVLHWVCILVTAYDNKSNCQSSKIFGIVLWIIPAISIIVSTTTYLFSVNIIKSPHIPLYILIGALFIMIGNYMPKTRQNRTIGIKVKWTLQSEANWNATHRVAGFTWVAIGIIILASAFLPISICIPVFIISVFFGVLIPTVYSYKFYKKELQDNTEFKEVKFPKRTKKISIIATILITIIIVLVCFTGEITYSLGESSLKVDSIWWSELKIEYSDINSVNLIKDCDFGTRISGFGTPRLSIGFFKNKVYNSYSLYAYTNNSTAIELGVEGKIILINAKSHDETVSLFEKISERIK